MEITLPQGQTEALFPVSGRALGPGNWKVVTTSNDADLDPSEPQAFAVDPKAGPYVEVMLPAGQTEVLFDVDGADLGVGDWLAIHGGNDADLEPFVDHDFEVIDEAPVTNPINVTPSSISGSVIQGSILTATPGVWDDAEGGVSGQWLRNGAPISGATATTYETTLTDLGRIISYREIAISASGGIGMVASNSLGPIEGDGPIVVKRSYAGGLFRRRVRDAG